MHTVDKWENCYPSNWKGKIVPEAMSHPAKYSSKLISRIYEHMIAEGWLARGDKVIDPFGGVALGAFDAMKLGLNWVGIELEKKHYRLGLGMDCPGFDKVYWRRYHARGRKWNELNICPNCGELLNGNGITSDFFGEYRRVIPTQEAHRYHGNIESWDIKYSHNKTAQLHNGDSRKLIEVLGLGGASVALSSPPYSDVMSKNNGGNRDKIIPSIGTGGAIQPRLYGETAGNLGNMREGGFDAALGSPPYAETDTAPGQIGAMKAENFKAAISSPPFLQSEGGTPEPKPGGSIDQALYARHAAGNKSANGYGKSEGQLSSMSATSFQVALSSPPYAQARIGQESGQGQCGRGDQYGESDGQLGSMDAAEFEAAVSSPPFEKTVLHDGGPALQQGGVLHSDYGQSIGQIGNESGDDFWLAARQIVEQVYLSLVPDGHAVWVVKGYVKNKKYVDFPDQWRQLCEAVGFSTVHEHHAMLVHHKGSQHTLEGGLIEKKTESKSFFRRLAEKKGSPRIDWETVFCMEKV